MGNMQMSLDKDFDSIAVKNAADAKEILKAIKKTEDKVSKFFEFKINLCLNIVPRRLGRNV